MKLTLKTVIFGFLGILLNSCNTGQVQKFTYPQIKVHPQSKQYFNKVVVDPFYQLKNLNDTTVKPWLKAQDSLAENYFLNNKLFSQYKKRFKKLDGQQESKIRNVKVSENGTYFYLRYNDSSQTETLYYRKGPSKPEVKLFDPKDYKNGGQEISYLSPSFNGGKIAVGFNPENNFASSVIFIDVAERKVMPDTISNINPEFGGIQWLPDSSGFIYLYFPYPNRNSPSFKKNTYSTLYRFGERKSLPMPIFGKEQTANTGENLYPKVKIGSKASDFAVGYLATSGDYYTSFITPIKDLIKGKPRWKPFFSKEDKVYWDQGKIRNEKFVYRKATDDGNELCQIDIENPDFSKPEIFAKGSSENPILDFQLTKDAIYFTRSKFGVEVSLYKITEIGKLRKLTLPFDPGYLDFYHHSMTDDTIGVAMDGWTSPFRRFLVDGKGNFRSTGLQREKSYPQFENITSKQVTVASHDGVEVPLSLVYDKNLDLDSAHEVFIYVYGAYGESMSPFFSPIFLDWVAQGGILAFPHVRGGGEKGQAWHRAGMKSLKYNSWKDLNACTDYLIKNRYTRKGKIALYTSSAGGITAGMAVNERPELYASFVAEVPRMNPLALEEAASASSSSYIEYGSIKDSLEFYGLLHMDPYLNLKENEKYPATLLMPSSSDDRIPIWDNAKYIAKLQQNTQDKIPFLMDINYTSGHDSAGSYEDYLTGYAKIFAFAKSNMKE